MPYIKKEDRKDIFDHGDNSIVIDAIDNSGELNFAITVLIQQYFGRNGGRYQQINDIIGALEGAKAEFYRRTVVPYEDMKIQENGDV